MIIARTPVRVSFLGGGTDLPAFYMAYGGEVLSAAVNKYFYTVVTGRDDPMIQVISSDFRLLECYDELDKVNPEEAELAIPLAVLRHLSPDRGMNIFLASEIPPGTGLGSSAAVCVNVLLAVSTFQGRNPTKHELAETAFEVATKRLRKPVGKQDEYAASFGGINNFVFTAEGTNVEPVRTDDETVQQLQDRLLLFFLGSSRDSSEILEEQNVASEKKDQQVIDALLGVKALVPRARQALIEGELDRFGRLLDEGWQKKKRFSKKVSNSAIDEVYALALNSGALGGKVTGAGGGGFLLLYVTPDRQAAVRDALSDHGLKEMRFRFDFHGARVIVNDPFLDAEGYGKPLWRFVKLT